MHLFKRKLPKVQPSQVSILLVTLGSSENMGEKADFWFSGLFTFLLSPLLITALGSLPC